MINAGNGSEFIGKNLNEIQIAEHEIEEEHETLEDLPVTEVNLIYFGSVVDHILIMLVVVKNNFFELN